MAAVGRSVTAWRVSPTVGAGDGAGGRGGGAGDERGDLRLVAVADEPTAGTTTPR
jgi:hypothetical protein